jgi:hypothetical protein
MFSQVFSFTKEESDKEDEGRPGVRIHVLNQVITPGYRPCVGERELPYNPRTGVSAQVSISQSGLSRIDRMVYHTETRHALTYVTS